MRFVIIYSLAHFDECWHRTVLKTSELFSQFREDRTAITSEFLILSCFFYVLRILVVKAKDLFYHSFGM
jgi:hypothetical protein